MTIVNILCIKCFNSIFSISLLTKRKKDASASSFLHLLTILADICGDDIVQRRLSNIAYCVHIDVVVRHITIENNVSIG